jgi:hypothetical protein
MKRAILVGVAWVVAVGAQPAAAGVISNGTYSVGITDLGNLYYPASGIGFVRLGDAYDPIAPGTPREAWGVSGGATAGYADGAFSGNSNIVGNGAVFGASTASVSTFLNNGSNVLRIDQNYAFAAPNVLAISTTVTNVSGSTQAVQFARHVDWDIAPTEFAESSTVPAVSGSVAAASCYGFEDPNPLTPLTGLSGFCSDPGTYGPADLGAAILLDLGMLGDGASASFTVFHGVGAVGMTSGELAALMGSLGASYVITGTSTSTDEPNNVAALGVGEPIPEPSSLLLIGSGLLMGARRLRRRS